MSESDSGRSGLAGQVARIPAVGPALLFAYRLRIAATEITKTVSSLSRWLVTSRETTNFTWDLTPLNRAYLAEFVSHVTGADRHRATELITELFNDAELADHVRRASGAGPESHRSDPIARYGRRAGWYAIARILRPRLIVETGVDKGLGACVLASALRRNAAEGHPGRYVGLELNPRKGWMFTAPYRVFGELRFGDSLASLRKLAGPVDMFIADSDHSYEHETAEYEAVAPQLSTQSIVISDESHNTPTLLDYARRTNREFHYWQEHPAGHWHRGAGIGVAVAPR